MLNLCISLISRGLGRYQRAAGVTHVGDGDDLPSASHSKLLIAQPWIRCCPLGTKSSTMLRHTWERAVAAWHRRQKKRKDKRRQGRRQARMNVRRHTKSDVNGDVGRYTKRDYLKTNMKRCIWTSTSSHAFGMKCPVCGGGPF